MVKFVVKFHMFVVPFVVDDDIHLFLFPIVTTAVSADKVNPVEPLENDSVIITIVIRVFIIIVSIIITTFG